MDRRKICIMVMNKSEQNKDLDKHIETVAFSLGNIWYLGKESKRSRKNFEWKSK